MNRGTAVLQTDEMEVGARQPTQSLDSAAELVALFDANVERFAAALAVADLESLSRP